MKRAASIFAPLAAAAVLIWSPIVASAAEPEQVSSKLFDVTVGAGPVLEITFALTLSDVSTYPVTITAIAGAVEEQLWDGTLPEGIYRLRAPLTKITSGPVRLVLRTKMTNLAAKGNQTFYVYRRWDGSISR